MLAHTGALVTVLDKLKLRGQPREPGGRDPARCDLVAGTSRTPASSTTWWARWTPWCTSPPSPTTTTPCGTPGPSCRPTWRTYTLLEAAGCTDAVPPTRPRTRCSGPGPGDPQRFTEDTAYRPSSPYSATKGGVGTTWCARGHVPSGWRSRCQLLQQLRSVPARGGSSRARSPRAHRQRPSCTARAERADWIHVADHSAAVLRILERGTPGRTYLVGGRRTDNLTRSGRPASHGRTGGTRSST
ncbi:hypothetical protein QJS66_07800 [Kocuria rhizophila]|nr:hypothetical protein QJS66_07800 [Kocuria rhizophila]